MKKLLWLVVLLGPMLDAHAVIVAGARGGG